MPANYWWVGNWWAGADAASSSAGVALDERIMRRIKEILETISVANGYHQNVTVKRPPEPHANFKSSDGFILSIRREGEQGRSHIRRAYEFVLTVAVICISPNTGATPEEDHADLRGDLKRIVHLNRRWNDGAVNLARRTWFLDTGVHETEVNEDTLTSEVVFQVLARADRNDLSQPKVV